MTVALTKGGNLPNLTTYNMIVVIWANQTIESFVYRWLREHAMFDVTCFPAFVKAWDVILKHFAITFNRFEQ